MIDGAPDVGLALEPERRGGRGLLLRQAVHLVVHDDVGHLDVLARGVREVITADGEGIAVAAKHEHVQVRSAEGHAGREGQGAAMNVVNAVRLHEIGKAAGAADAGDSRDLLVPDRALFDEFEVKREHREVTATGAPGRVIGGDFFLEERLAGGIGQRGRGGEVARPRGEFVGDVEHVKIGSVLAAALGSGVRESEGRLGCTRQQCFEL